MRRYKSSLSILVLLVGVGFLLSCFYDKDETELAPEEFTPALIADSFDYPVGPPDAEGYYNAQKFTVNNHLGDDWNANTGGNTDLGDPIHAIGNGVVSGAADYGGGWGNVIRIIHQLKDGSQVESLYAHCDKIMVKKGQQVKKGDQIGTIGNVGGLYSAHLHLEIREKVFMSLGGGYSSNTTGYLDPTKFIDSHR